ncbi:MAG: hypothetical protein GKR94_06990 [Gammaproteobacteria bacterium]|nr:hypothetical protein [Gammaproteobacteria bacterium]
MRLPVILGIGTGRCGTLSLATLLNAQEGAAVTHERFSYELKWEATESTRQARVRDIIKSSGEGMIGDVHSAWLPYVEHALAASQDVKIICLRRARAAVIQSFLDWLDPVEHWTPAKETKSLWSDCFPTYPDLHDRREALSRYWDAYYVRVSQLMRHYPRRIRVFNTQDLNAPPGIERILSFAGVPVERQRIAVFHEHKGPGHESRIEA